MKIVLTVFLAFLMDNLWAAKVRLEISNPWVRQTVAGQSAAGYLSINNNTDNIITLNSIKCDGFISCEFHETVSEAGLSRMRHLALVKIQPNTKIEFKPGGKHIMMMKANKDLSPGTTLNVILSDSTGRKTNIRFKVQGYNFSPE